LIFDLDPPVEKWFPRACHLETERSKVKATRPKISHGVLYDMACITELRSDLQAEFSSSSHALARGGAYIVFMHMLNNVRRWPRKNHIDDSN